MDLVGVRRMSDFIEGEPDFQLFFAVAKRIIFLIVVLGLFELSIFLGGRWGTPVIEFISVWFMLIWFVSLYNILSEVERNGSR